MGSAALVTNSVTNCPCVAQAIEMNGFHIAVLSASGVKAAA